ncbi:hypothetical protein niasHT_009538 [Heterodera trifolii]|uniref:Uncharacterized protein n=1 Tax=Heterodera trifolii TaxID=157864 RepID=A0ABD2LQZ3_9BILA
MHENFFYCFLSERHFLPTPRFGICLISERMPLAAACQFYFLVRHSGIFLCFCEGIVDQKKTHILQLIDQPASRWPVISQQQHYLISHCFIIDNSLISSGLTSAQRSSSRFGRRARPQLHRNRDYCAQVLWDTGGGSSRSLSSAGGGWRWAGSGRMAISAPGAPVPSAASALSSMSRSRLSTSLEPIGLAGTSWNSIRWARPSAGAGYRTSRLASTFETSGASAGGATSACSSSSAASTSATAPRTHSPPFGYAKLRSSDRAASTSRPLNDGTVIRANSRYGTTLLSSSGYSPINARAVSQHSVACGGAGGGSSSLKSPRRQQTATKTTAPALVAYRPISGSSSISQPRAALIDMRQNLRPVNKRHSVTDHHLLHSSTMPMRTSSASTLLSNSVRAAFAASSSAMAPPAALFTNVSPTSSSATK